MHTITIYLKKQNPLMPYFKKNMNGSRAVRNTANYLIRNVYTALGKAPEERSANENAVLLKVSMCLREANLQREEAYQKKVASGKAKGKLTLHQIPDEKHRMLSYGQIDAILKLSENEAYYSCTSQVNQQAIKKTCKSWKGFFNSLKDWKKNPSKYQAKPRIPGYIREKESTAHFTNQVSKLTETENGYEMTFTKSKHKLFLGKIPVVGTHVKTEIVPCSDGCRMLITFEDGICDLKVPKTAEKILAIDPGLDNFAACTTNTGMTPFLIDGRYFKSINRFFNKELGKMRAKLYAGKDPKDSSVPHSSKAIRKLCDKRYRIFRDAFFKVAHYICREAQKEGVTLILFGHNRGQKQEISIGAHNNQNFVQIPYMQFFHILKCVARKYDIAVDEQEESYTSKSDFLCGDKLPTYKTGSGKTYVFSGKRIRRGLYQSGNGIVLNADINGSANILRKRFPNAFKSIDTTTLLSVRKVQIKDLYPSKKLKKVS